jgi:hypothetical protein
VSRLPESVRDVLREGVLCYLAAPSPVGPHVTPVVYVLDGDRLWGTPGRGTTKASRWRDDPGAGGAVGVGGRSVSFRGRVTLYDALDPGTWPASLRRGPQVARASARFMAKNARFFAGYARDVGTLPLAWTPPARVVFSVDLEAAAILDEGRLTDRWGSWGGGVEALGTFRRSSRGLSPARLPEDLKDLAGRSGGGTVGIGGRLGPVVVPCRWARSGGVFYAVISRAVLELAGSGKHTAGSLVVDRASSWRAARMKGLLFRGPASLFVPRAVRSGSRALAEVIARAGESPPDPAVVRISPRTAVWWRGWSSGTVGRR